MVPIIIAVLVAVVLTAAIPGRVQLATVKK